MAMQLWQEITQSDKTNESILHHALRLYGKWEHSTFKLLSPTVLPWTIWLLIKARGGRAVFQLYPETPEQVSLLKLKLFIQ